VKHEAANDFRIGEGNDQLRGAGLSSGGGWNAEGVSQSVKVNWHSIDFRHQKPGLVDMEIMILRIPVQDRPLLGVAKLDCYVDPIFIEYLLVDEKF